MPFDASNIKPFQPVKKIWISQQGKRLNDLDDEKQDTHRLTADLTYSNTPTKRTYLDLRHIHKSTEHIKRLPDSGETIHAVVSGSYPQYATIPSIYELGGTIADLHIITLSFSKNNIIDLCRMIDEKQITKTAVIVSHYFAATNDNIFNPAAEAIRTRGQRITALRSHAKIMLASLADRRKFIVEGSANLRSCKNIEQFTLTNCPALYSFHRGWIEELLGGK